MKNNAFPTIWNTALNLLVWGVLFGTGKRIVNGLYAFSSYQSLLLINKTVNRDFFNLGLAFQIGVGGDKRFYRN